MLLGNVKPGMRFQFNGRFAVYQMRKGSYFSVSEKYKVYPVTFLNRFKKVRPYRGNLY